MTDPSAAYLDRQRSAIRTLRARGAWPTTITLVTGVPECLVLWLLRWPS